MLTKKINFSGKGFSLVEVLVFVVVVSIFFTAAASIASYLIRTSKVNERKLIATRYADELIEWLRSEKEIDWVAFSAHGDSAGTVQHCFGTLSWSSPSCNIDTVLTRRAYLKQIRDPSNYVYQIQASVEVNWTESGKNYTVPLKTTFSVWETGVSPTP